MRVVFLTPAQSELVEAKQYYNKRQTGLGERFKAVAQASARLVAERPLSWQRERGPVRRCLIRGFPYKLLYVVRDHEVVVIAVAHTHRKPAYWLDRLNLL